MKEYFKRVINDVEEFWFWFITGWVLFGAALAFFFCRLLRRDEPTPAPAQPEPVEQDTACVPVPPSVVAEVRRELAEMVAEAPAMSEADELYANFEYALLSWLSHTYQCGTCEQCMEVEKWLRS